MNGHLWACGECGTVNSPGTFGEPGYRCPSCGVDDWRRLDI